jgi:hypothetical protein
MDVKRKNRLETCFDEQMEQIRTVDNHAIQLRILQMETEGRWTGLPITELIEDMERLKALGQQRMQRLCVELKALGWNRPNGAE